MQRLSATACYARRGLYHWFAVIDIVIYLFVQLVRQLSLKMLLLLQLLIDFNKILYTFSNGPVFFKKKLLICAYIAYISKVITTFIFQFYHVGAYMRLSYTHHTITLIKSISLHQFSFFFKLKHMHSIVCCTGDCYVIIKIIAVRLKETRFEW